MAYAAGSLANRSAQSLSGPNFGTVAFDQTPVLFHATLSSDSHSIIVQESGLYLIQYGVQATTGAPGMCTILFTPGGRDNAGRIPLAANTMVSGSIVRPMGAGTYVSLWIESTNNNTTISLPAFTDYANAYLSVSRIGPFPTGS